EPNPTPWSNYPISSGYDQQQQQQQQQQDPLSANPSGIWGWISNNKMLATVVEKAKTGIETVITTVDPQMKQYIRMYILYNFTNTNCCIFPERGHEVDI
ncbi:unnamed protein product, partial [Adineta steineri]